MMLSRQVSIKVRLMGLVGILLAGVLCMGVAGWWGMRDAAAHLAAQGEEAQRIARSIDLARGAQVAFKIQIQEWKNTLLRGGDPEAFAKYRAAFVKEGDVVQDRLQALKQVTVALGMPTGEIDQSAASLADLKTKYLAALASFDANDPAGSAKAVDAQVKGMDREPTKQIDAIVEHVVKTGEAREIETMAAAQASMQDMSVVMTVVLCAAVLVGGGVGWSVLLSVTRPLDAAVSMAQQVAEGKLGLMADVQGNDELAKLQEAMGRMSGSLQGVVMQVRDAADMVAHASGEIATGNIDLSSRTELQASSLQETVAAIGQLSTGVQHGAEHAGQAQALALRASAVAEQGGAVVNEVVQTMSDINASSRKISDIIGVIDGIAFQTNILALNAAVEAARAGEQGRGFAVVASEVRTLAQRSANAAKEIKSLINASVECVGRGSTLVGQAGETIAQAVVAVQQVRDVVAEISAAASEQAAGIQQVNQAVSAIDNTMQQNAALVEQAAAAATSLKQQADSLQASVGFFHT